MSSIFDLGLEGGSKENYLKSIIKSVFDYTVIVDREYKIIYFHKKPYFIPGTVMDEGKSIYDYIDKVDQENFTRDYTRALQGEEIERERKIRTVNNNVSYIIVTYMPIIISNGDINGVCITYKDITSKKISESQRSKNTLSLKKILDEKRTELKELKEDRDSIKKQYDALYNNITDISFTMELSYSLSESRLIKGSHHFLKEMGYLEDEIFGLVFKDIIKLNEESLNEQDFMNRVIKEGFISFQAHTITKDNTLLPFEFDGHILKLKRRHILTIIGRSLSDKIAQEQSIREKLGRDPVSGTLNRVEGFRLMNKDMEESMKNKDIISIIYLDINDMNKINYKFGHIIGDRVIREFAEAVTNTISNDTVFFRVDGDEFILYVKNKPKDVIYNIIADIKKELSRINNTEDYKFNIDCSYGLATFDGVIDIELDKLVYIAERDMLKKRK